MSELTEKDPQLSAVIDTQSGRNLLDPSNPEPLEVDLTTAQSTRFKLSIENGPEGLIELAITADEDWLKPESSRLTLVGGEKHDLILTATGDGDSPFGNLLISWEGNEQTFCQSVMIVRALLQPEPSNDASQPEIRTSNEQRERKKQEALDSLSQLIMGCGGPDKFIDVDEENKIFRKGGALELSFNQVESLLNLKCSEGGWTRQNRLTEKLTAMLNEATKDDGVIDKQEFDHVVNFAVQRKMPRRDSIEHCVTLVLDNAWKPKEGLLDKWFTKLRKQFGL